MGQNESNITTGKQRTILLMAQLVLEHKQKRQHGQGDMVMPGSPGSPLKLTREHLPISDCPPTPAIDTAYDYAFIARQTTRNPDRERVSHSLLYGITSWGVTSDDLIHSRAPR
jgi:hypothetical protein